MLAAFASVNDSGLSVRQAAKLHGVPRSSLQERINGKRGLHARWGKAPILSAAQEEKLTRLCIMQADRGTGLCRQDIRKAAAGMVEGEGVFKNPLPSNKWVHNFARRNNLSLRTPEATPVYRHKAMSKEKVAAFFLDLLILLAENNGIPATSVWNMDETGLQLEHTPPKVLTR